MFRKLFLGLIFTTSFAFGVAAQGCGQQNPNCIVPTAPPGTSNNQAASTAFVQNIVGESTIILPSPSLLASAILPTNAIYVNIAAMATINAVGESTCNLLFSKGASSPTGVYGEILNSPSGVYWEPKYSTSPVKTCEFGAIGDGQFDYATNAVTGTDNITPIQQAIDFAIQGQYNTVCMNDGSYLTSDTIQLGWGNLIYTIGLTACSGGRGPQFGRQNGVMPSQEAAAGVVILPTKTDRCALNMQGAFNTGVKGITFIGQNYTFVGNLIGNIPYPTTASAWLNPSLIPSGNNPGGLQQHSPYAAICINAFTGAQPTDHYPTVTYPAWTGIMAQYNLDISSDFNIEDVSILGFAVGIVGSPNGDTNGDFIKVNRFVCYFTVYCLSVGNTQSRGVLASNWYYHGTFTAISNNVFGVQNGLLGGPISNLVGGEAYQAFQIQNNLLFPITITDTYVENHVRIGSFIGTTGSFSQSVTFDGGLFNFFATDNGISPAAYIEVPSGCTSFTFKDMAFEGGNRIDTLVHGCASVSISGGAFEGAFNAAVLNSAAVQRAINYTGSVLIGSAANFPIVGQQQVLQWGTTTSAQYFSTPNPSFFSAQNFGPNADFRTFGLRAPFTQATTGFVDSINGRQWQFALGPTGAALDISSNAYTSVPAAISSCDTMTFTYLGSPWASLQQFSLTAGDIIYHSPTGTIYVVTIVGSVDGSGNFPITTKQMNNMTITSMGACASNNISDPTVSGTSIIIHTGVNNIPSQVLFGDFVEGSTSVSNVQQAPGFGANLSAFVSANDLVWAYPAQDTWYNWPYIAGGKIATVTNGTPASLTLSAASSLTGRFPILPLPIIGSGIQFNTLNAPCSGSPSSSFATNINGQVTHC